MHSRLRLAATALGAVALGSLPLAASFSHAADHVDSPANAMDGAADLTDVYAWHTSTKLSLSASLWYSRIRPENSLPKGCALKAPQIWLI